MYFAGDNGYQMFLVFATIFSSLILGSNKKLTNWISTAVSLEKIKPYDTNLESIMPNLANGIVISKFNNFVLVQKSSSSLYSNVTLNLYLAYELNNWPRHPINDFLLKNVYLAQPN